MSSRNQLVIIAAATVSSVSGSGPSYTVDYLTNTTSVQVGDRVVVHKRAAGAGTGSTILSTYHYRGTAVATLLNRLTLQYQSDTGGLGDDSPADLYSGGGSSGSPQIAPHEVRRDLGDSFIMFVE